MNTKLKTVSCIAAVAAAAGIGNASADSFVPLYEPTCIYAPYFWEWTVGGQYSDSNNGVIPGDYSMLVRWQGDDMVSNAVSYDMGAFTSLHVFSQRGRQPEDPNGSPGVQVDCYEQGMLVNTWDTPHRPVIGGGYNDIWGYSWPTGSQPHPFVDGSGNPAELVLQGNLGVATYGTYGSGTNYGQASFFAYVRDTTHPSLHPIAIIANAYISNWMATYATDGDVWYDYSDNDSSAIASANPAWYPSGASGNGVWFASGPISTTYTNPYVTTRYSQGSNDGPLNPIYSTNPAFPFWRAHITQTNLTNAITNINGLGMGCSPPSCPSAGYSSNPADYVLEYAGVIMEVRLGSEIVYYGANVTSMSFDASPTSWIPNDASKPQASMGLHVHAFGVYQYLP
jgi:hypothetical protein